MTASGERVAEELATALGSSEDPADAIAAWEAVLSGALVERFGRTPADAARQAAMVVALIEGALLLDRTAGGTWHLVQARQGVGALLAG